MRGSHHPCAEFPGLYVRCAHYEGFPPSLREFSSFLIIISR
ncbi:unnamed protein product [Staurois parvus]|uniref:Uncharacterized protein n=1 Tax=Staurois parvus TaxID=386267 RepID=A0ABN9BHB2_9NEOB|nr:unnamed protein product [Staurois parvus]